MWLSNLPSSTSGHAYEAVFISKILFTVQIQLCLLVIQLCPLVIQLYILVIQLSSCHSILSVCHSIIYSCHSIKSGCHSLCSILSFSYYFLLLNYPWSFSHLIITVCHAISYFMNFIELWLLRFNYSISIDRLYLSPQKHRSSMTDVSAQTASRLSCTTFENGFEGNSRCERFRQEKEKIINKQ